MSRSFTPTHRVERSLINSAENVKLHGCFCVEGKLTPAYATVGVLPAFSGVPTAVAYSPYTQSYAYHASSGLFVQSATGTNRQVFNGVYADCNIQEFSTPQGIGFFALHRGTLYDFNEGTQTQLGAEYTSFTQHAGRVFYAQEGSLRLVWTALGSVTQTAEEEGGGYLDLNDDSLGCIQDIVTCNGKLYIVRENGFSRLQGLAQSENYAVVHGSARYVGLVARSVYAYQNKLVFLADGKVWIGDENSATPLAVQGLKNLTPRLAKLCGEDYFFSAADEKNNVGVYVVNLHSGCLCDISIPIPPEGFCLGKEMYYWGSANRVFRLGKATSYSWQGDIMPPTANQKACLREIRLPVDVQVSLYISQGDVTLRNWTQIKNAVPVMMYGEKFNVYVTGNTDYSSATVVWEVKDAI